MNETNLQCLAVGTALKNGAALPWISKAWLHLSSLNACLILCHGASRSRKL
jgi:hypothetical protein